MPSTRNGGSGSKRKTPRAGGHAARRTSTTPRSPSSGPRKRSPQRKRRRPGGLTITLRWPSRATVKRLSYWAAVLALWVGIGMAGIVGYYAYTLPDTSPLWDIRKSPSLTVLTEDGRVLARRGVMQGLKVEVSELPPHLISAVLATEDRRFYDHIGVDVMALGRAALANLAAGHIVQGGSTITQQLAKNLFLKPERTMRRKIQELILALWLEARLTKDQILSLYLNRVYFGAGAYGVEAASQRYFNKSARQLTLSEAALLAGLLKAPSRYSPASDLPAAQARAELVLENMRNAGFLDDVSYALASAAPAELAEGAGTEGIYYFVDWIAEQLPSYIGNTEENLTVVTTLDPFLQYKAEAVVAEAINRDGSKLGASQAALVAMEPNGAVRAMVGGRSYADSQFNRAVQALRQPGSAFKPFVYLAALEAGYRPDTIMIDQPVAVGEWEPDNYGNNYLGHVSLREGLSKSLNSVAVQLSENVGRWQVIDVARRLGIASNLKPTPSIALGTSETTLFELVSAYAPFANGGQGIMPYAILEIRGADGTVLYERVASGFGRVIAREHVAAMNDMLRETVLTGTGRKAALAGRPVAGKTGTSQDFRDAWFVGYSADLVAGIWVGNDDNTPMSRVTGGNMPANMWKDFMFRTQRDVQIAQLPGVGAPVPLLPGEMPLPDKPLQQVPREDDRGFFERLFGL